MVGGTKSQKLDLQRAVQTVARFLLWFVVALASVQPTLAQTDPLARALTLVEQAERLSEQSRYVEAISKANEALTLWEQALGPNNIIVASSLEWIGVHHIAAKDYTAARPLFQRALKIREDIQGPDHPALLGSLDKLAFILSATGDYSQARILYQRALQIRERAFGPDHPDVVKSLQQLAWVHRIARDHATAKALYERALRINEKALGAAQLNIAENLTNLAEVHRAKGEYAEAKSLLERALGIREQALGPAHKDVAASLYELAEVLVQTGDYHAARGLHERALTIREQTLGPVHYEVAASLGGLAEVLRQLGDFTAARLMFERAVKVYEQALGPNHPLVSSAFYNLGLFLETVGDYPAAKASYERSLAIREHTRGPLHPDVATSLSSLASFFLRIGDYVAAGPLFERALNIREQALGPSNLDTASSLFDLAELHRAASDYDKAKPLYERALTIREQALGPNHPTLASSLSGLALNLWATGELAGARALCERALVIREQALGPMHPDVAESLSNLAELLQLAGDYATARPLYERALKMREQVFGPNHAMVAASLYDVAELLRAIGDYAAAKPLYERALAIRERILGPTHPDAATSLRGLGELLYTTGDYAAAKPLYERALAIREKVFGPNHPIVASSLLDLGYYFRTIGDLSPAKSLYERALGIREATLGPNHPDTALSLGGLAIVEWGAGRSQEARPKLDRAKATLLAHIIRGLVGLSTRQKLAFLETFAPLTSALLSLPSGLVPEANAYQAVLDWKNLLFRSVVAERTLIEANPSPQVAALLRQYTAIRRQLAATTVGGVTTSDLPDYRIRLTRLAERRETLEGELSRASAVFRETQGAVAVGSPDVCAAVPADAVLVDLLVYDRGLPPTPSTTPHYVAFVLRGGECANPVCLELGPAAPIDEDVRRFRETVGRDVPDPDIRVLRANYRKALASRLSAKLFPPALRQAIAGKPHLLISPDGALALLPFALLPGEDGHEFLLETRTISYLPSGRDLLRSTAPHLAVPGLLAVGAPAFDLAPAETAQAATLRAGCGVQDERFAPLPGTAAELRTIAAVYQQAHPTQSPVILDGLMATKAALVERASRAGVLHLATHAYFAGEECSPAGLVSERQRGGADLPAFLGYNPLLLSGVALAGANERDKADGILTALEVTALDLRSTSLVVLSACDTGLGTPARGQELLGLRWAFAYAGARNLVTSLWTVPDVETATLMSHFYKALWLRGLSVPAALRAAQLEMLQAARARGDSAPYSWGAFVGSGLRD